MVTPEQWLAQGSGTPDIERYILAMPGWGFDLVAQDEIGAGVAGLGLVELVAEGGQAWVRPGRGERCRDG